MLIKAHTDILYSMLATVIRQSNFSTKIKHQHQRLTSYYLFPASPACPQQLFLQTPDKNQLWLAMTPRQQTVGQAPRSPTCPRAEQMIHFLLPKLFCNEELVVVNSAPGDEAEPRQYHRHCSTAEVSRDLWRSPKVTWARLVRFQVPPPTGTPQPLCNWFQRLTPGKEQMPRCSPEVNPPGRCLYTERLEPPLHALSSVH